MTVLAVQHPIVAVVVGTRPEMIKLAPVMDSLRTEGSGVRPVLISTGQHQEMLDQTLAMFGLTPDIELDVMRPDQSLARLSARLLDGLTGALERVSPALVLVQGDTTTAFVGALVAFYQGVPVGHVEAGLRTDQPRNPFPEEMNRRLTARLTELHFAPTERAREQLMREGVDASSIYVTGNTVVDALQAAARRLDAYPRNPAGLDEWLDPSRRLVLVTAHRRESFGHGLEQICTALRTLATRYEREIQLVFPVHLNPRVRGPIYERLSAIGNLRLLPPVDYLDLVALMRRAWLVVTDSGGIQEEAPAFGKPVLVMRQTTERPEGVEAGCAKLVGTEAAAIVDAVTRLLENGAEYRGMAVAKSPYGDGHAAERIAGVVREFVGLRSPVGVPA